MKLKLSSIRKVLFRNFWLKVLSVGVAIVTWRTILSQISFEVTLTDIPIEIEVAEKIAILSQRPTATDIVVQGSQDDIRRLDSKTIRVVLNHSGRVVPGLDNLQITKEDVKGLRAGVNVLEIKPKNIEIKLDEATEREVKVIPQIEGTPLFGEVGEVSVEPDHVTLTGPRGRLEEIEFVTTEPIDVEGLQLSFTKAVKVVTESEEWTPVVTPELVEVSVPIERENDRKAFSNMLVTAIVPAGVPAEIRLVPETVEVVLSGGKEFLADIKSSDISVFVNCVDMKPGDTQDLRLNIHLPNSGQVAATTVPATVKVHMRKLEQEAPEPVAPEGDDPEGDTSPEESAEAESAEESGS